MEGRVEDSVPDHEVFGSPSYESYKATLESLLREMVLVKPCNIQLNLCDKIYMAKYKESASKKNVYTRRGIRKSYEEVSTRWDPKI
jgi:hypothetical protein